MGSLFRYLAVHYRHERLRPGGLRFLLHGCDSPLAGSVATRLTASNGKASTRLARLDCGRLRAAEMPGPDAVELRCSKTHAESLESLVAVLT
jgi:hypothetical protein